ncbi:MAG: 50S ribosomal protein L10 [Thermodesulfobacteriota bacterium]
MNRKQKEEQVAWLHEQFSAVQVLFLADCQGMKVSEMDRLRAEMRSRGASVKILKNTLARRAYEGTPVSVIGDSIVGPRAATWTSDPNAAPAMAKALIDFAKTHPNLELVMGVLSGKKVTPADMEALAKLPSREELLSQLLGTLIAPVSNFVGTLAAVPRSLLNVLKAIEDKKKDTPEAA